MYQKQDPPHAWKNVSIEVKASFRLFNDLLHQTSNLTVRKETLNITSNINIGIIVSIATIN